VTTVAIETSVRPGSVAVSTVNGLFSAALEHDRDLLTRLEILLAEGGSEPADIRVVIVGTGPGSFTGLRVGIATALGLVRGTGAVLFGLPSIEAMPYSALEPGAEAIVLLDARSRQLYYARYRRTEDDVEVLAAPCVATPSDLDDLYASDVPILGDETVADAAELSEDARLRLRTDVQPTAQHLLAMGTHRLRARGPMQAEEVQPLYLRPFMVRERKR
jgi:tRNA threonylcarbamoyl adenosine modification protein YeaZ